MRVGLKIPTLEYDFRLIPNQVYVVYNAYMRYTQYRRFIAI